MDAGKWNHKVSELKNIQITIDGLGREILRGGLPFKIAMIARMS